MKISYNWLKYYIPHLSTKLETGVPLADALRDIFTYHLCEVGSLEILPSLWEGPGMGQDTIFDLNILPNRAHDLLSHQGIARELASQLGLGFNDSATMYKTPIIHPAPQDANSLEIGVQTPSCRRYMGRIIRNIKVEPSPKWIVERLESIGQKSINNIVDVTNLVMFDCGQPCHAFDLDKLTNSHIIIRNANEKESLTTLTGQKVTLNSSDIVISDKKNILAIAGIKGGKHAEVDENTKNIIVEIANFDPVTVRKTSRMLGILTDSSKRFENDLSPELCEFAMKELSGLIMEMCPDAEFEKIIDIYPAKQEKRKITFSVDFVNKKLGSSFSKLEIEDILKKYHYIYSPLRGDEKIYTNGVFEIIVPALRLDLTIPEDMVEEIGRIMGYDKVKDILPTRPRGENISVPLRSEGGLWDTILLAKKILVSQGYREVYTYSFTNKGDLSVLASASDKNFLRTNLSNGLKESIALNKNNSAFLGLDTVKVFEVGTVFPKSGENIHVAYGDNKKIEETTFDEFLTRFASDSETMEKISSELHLGEAETTKFFIPWSPYPSITRDIAVWIPLTTSSDALQLILQKHAGELLIRVPRLVDKYEKDGRVSYAYRLIFQSYERTLTDEEVNSIMDNLYNLCIAQGWEIR